MNQFIFAATVMALWILTGCNNQAGRRPPEAARHSKIVGGGCDGCELMYVGMPDTLSATDTSAGWFEEGQRLLVTGTAFRPDGKTPAPNVIIYYWQTDSRGYYAPRPGMDERAKRHGHIRGWVKTDANGRYAIYTIRPAPYPGKTMPAHIHTAIKEPALENEYYIDEFVFDDDPLLTTAKRKKLENRGGSGILRMLLNGPVQVAEHNIVLGLHIPNYPVADAETAQSGLPVGEDQPSFTPFHAVGPDKGTRTCPVCKYGRYQGILYFVGNQPRWNEIGQWLPFLEKESIKRQQYLKVYFVYGNSDDDRWHSIAKLEKLGAELNLHNIALTFVPGFMDAETEVVLNKINPLVQNTFILYKNRSIVDKYINLTPTAQNFEVLASALDRTRGDYFSLPEPVYR